MRAVAACCSPGWIASTLKSESDQTGTLYRNQCKAFEGKTKPETGSKVAESLVATYANAHSDKNEKN